MSHGESGDEMRWGRTAVPALPSARIMRSSSWLGERNSLCPPLPTRSPRTSTSPRRSCSRFRLIMLEGIAKALTRPLLQDNSGIGIRDVSERVTAFVSAVRARLG
jgi:hypothetical protein